MARRRSEDAVLDMTPMIDIVFQLIIFFVVTVTIQKEYNKEIELERSPYGPPIEGEQSSMIIEVDKRGWLSMHGAQMSPQQLRGVIRRRYKRSGEFPVIIRGDKRTRHADVRSVMDMLTDVGIWRISFAAMKEKAM